MYKGGAFLFTFTINSNYPHDPPKVKCIPKVGSSRATVDDQVAIQRQY
jgi:ubiquitin-conjugating enzyme E2 M